MVKNNYLPTPSIFWWKFHKIFHCQSDTSNVCFHYASLFVHSCKLPCFLQLVMPFTLLLKTFISTTRRTVVRSVCIVRSVGMPVAIIMKKEEESWFMDEMFPRTKNTGWWNITWSATCSWVNCLKTLQRFLSFVW